MSHVARVSTLCLVSLSLAAMVAFPGCGSGGPTPVPVTGVVTLDDNAVEAATVTFSPQFEGSPAMGTTDKEGKFTLKTQPLGEGALPGKHLVSVRKVTMSGVQADQDGLSGPPAPGGVQEQWFTPKKYADAKGWNHTVEVKSGMEPVELKLTSQ